MVQDKVELSAVTGKLDLMLGKELLKMENITFLPHEFLCEAGAIPQGEFCGKIFELILYLMFKPINCSELSCWNALQRGDRRV